LACGRKSIAYLGPDDKRVQGYQQALWEQNISAHDHFIMGGADTQSGYNSCEELIQSGLAVDAICAGSDEVAIGVLNCLYRNGLHVPDDIAVASIDNLDISAFTIPALTTVDVPRREIGMHAIETLMSTKPHQRSSSFAITVRTELIIRESTPKH
jgi:LacI family transcriptional regulator